MAITLAFLTKNVLVSLATGVVSGSYLISLGQHSWYSSVLHAFLHFTSTVQDVVADPWNAGIILQTLTIGGLIGLVAYMGGNRAIAESLAKRARTASSAQLYTWLMGLFIFFDDYANALTVGPIMRPVTDRMKISREKLAFIIDATAAPIAGIALISTWVGYELGLIADGFSALGLERNAYSVFVATIPYRFYNIFILFFIVVSAVLLRDFGPMLKAEKRARKGQAFRKDAKLLSDLDRDLSPDEKIKPRIRYAAAPVATLIIAAFVGLYFNGYLSIMGGDDRVLAAAIEAAPLSGVSVRACFSASSAAIVLFQAALLASFVSIGLGLYDRVMNLEKAIEVWIKGAKSLIFTILILALAWSLSSVIKELNTAVFLVQMLGDSLPEFTLPAIIFILGALISFATGTSYGTMGILMPLAIPLAYALDPSSAFMNMSIGAVLTGAIFGDHCSPISDTTILSSMGASCDHIDHTRTQLFYALPVAFIAVFLGYIPVGLGLNPLISLAAGLISVYGLLRFAGQRAE